jgi:hypothetical protein
MFTRSRKGSSGASSSNPPQRTPKEERYYTLREELVDRMVISTPTLDFELLEEMGILEDFTRLTERVGFKRRFWEIPTRYQAYEDFNKGVSRLSDLV